MLLLAAMAGATARAGTWSDLWATREQQAQQLLDSKRPAEAASLFRDPRRQAYAELQAGQYDKAAEHLKPFKDADSQYNRGNALAHAGQLQDALAAYDAALVNSPGNRDVIRNRDLVARALKQQSQADQHNNAGNSQQGNQGSGQKQSNSAQSGQGQKGQEGQKQDNGAADQGAQPDGQGQQGKEGSQRGSPAQAGNQPQPGNQAQAGNPSQPGNQAQAGNPSQLGNQQQSANPPQPGNRAQQANPTAASGDATADDLKQAAQSQASRSNGSDAAQAESGQHGNSQDDAISANKALPGSDSLSQKPRSEQALALDQWLRGIPEDSGELLRRKFLIEHMMKQQGNEQ
jgi:Ca-activated chloride channel homolog